MNDPISEKNENRIIDIRIAAGRRERGGKDLTPRGENRLENYQQPREPDDYRHRMITNGIALCFLIFLIIAGVWIADTMAAMRKNQDCVLSGRRGCTPVDVLLR